MAHGLIFLDIKDSPLRVKTMAERVFTLIDEYQPDIVTIEDDFQKNNVKTTIMLSNLGGMILGYCYGKGVQAGKILPSVWRKILNYPGGKEYKAPQLKQISIDNVQSWYGIDVGEDEAEAICIGKAAYILNTQKNKQ